MEASPRTGTYEFTSFTMGASETGGGLGPGCITLTPGGPYTGSPCGPIGELTTSTIDVTTKIGACLVPIGQSSDVLSTGRSIDVNDASPPATCGYSSEDIQCIQARVAALQSTAKYLMISCSDMDLPEVSTQTCLSGGRAVSVTVAWTADDADDCTTECPSGGCLAGVAEAVE